MNKRVASRKTQKSKGTTPPSPQAPNSYPALRFTQGAKSSPHLVVFHAPVGEILGWSEVVALTSDKKPGHQRERRQAKVTAIKKFMASDPRNVIPTAVVLAFPKGMAHFSDRGKGSGELILDCKERVFASIVDGQHRLLGMKEHSPRTRVAVVGLLESDEIEKAFQFLVINNKSSRVPATHTKALLARYQGTQLAERLRAARISFETEGIRDVDLVNSDKDSPFYQSIAWTTTPPEKRMVQATAIESSLEYIGSLGVPEFEDRDVRRSVFLTMWKRIKEHWPKLWTSGSRLISKVGVVCLTRFVADLIVSWADNEALDIELTDLGDIEEQTTAIVSRMNSKFWTAKWSETAQGGFDTSQGRERVVRALTQLYRNGRHQEDWFTDIEIIDPASDIGEA